MNDRYGRTPEEQKALQATIALANAEAEANWDNPQWRREMAQEMTETIYRGFQHENLLSLIAEVENAPFGGRVFVKEIRGLRAFWVARGGFIEASTVHAEVLEIPRDTVGFHVNEFEDKIMLDFAETQANLIDLGIQRLDAEVNSRMLRLFQAAVPSTSSSYVSGSGLSLTALNTAIRGVQDASRQRKVTIVGRATMVEQIMEQLVSSNSYPAFLPQTNEQLLNTGVLGTYRGCQLISLINWLDDTDTAFFPANELYVVAPDASKFAFWGGLMSKEWVESDAWYWHYITRRDFGGVVHRPDRLRRIVDTSLAA